MDLFLSRAALLGALETGAAIRKSCNATVQIGQQAAEPTQNFLQRGRKEFERRGVLFLYVQVDAYEPAW